MNILFMSEVLEFFRVRLFAVEFCHLQKPKFKHFIDENYAKKITKQMPLERIKG